MKFKTVLSVIVFSASLMLMLLAACAPGAQAGQSAISSEEVPVGYKGFVERLRASGAEVEEAESVEQVFMSVPGRIINVNGVDVQVFEYADEADRLADSDMIPEDGASFPTIMVTWIDQPHFWADGRLIVLYVGSDQAIVDLLTSLLGVPIAG